MGEVIDEITETKFAMYATQWLTGHFQEVLPPIYEQDVGDFLEVSDDWDMLCCLIEMLDLSEIRGFFSEELPETRGAIERTGMKIPELDRVLLVGVLGAIWLKSGREGPCRSTRTDAILVVQALVEASMEKGFHDAFVKAARMNVRTGRGMGGSDNQIRGAMFASLIHHLPLSSLKAAYPTYFKWAQNAQLEDEEAHLLFIRCLAGIAVRQL